ncbi:hypothetical protein G6F31_019312 [Rhizopus arrhizus]|nr:hypothetical protein G6F31_019312 [Rhizopus arrhizus]
MSSLGRCQRQRGRASGRLHLHPAARRHHGAGRSAGRARCHRQQRPGPARGRPRLRGGAVRVAVPPQHRHPRPAGHGPRRRTGKHQPVGRAVRRCHQLPALRHPQGQCTADPGAQRRWPQHAVRCAGQG